MGEVETVDNSGWYAYVRYKSGEKKEFVPISSIREKKMGQSKRVQFNPKSLTDFDNTKWYFVKTTLDSSDGEPHRWAALIGRLGMDRDSLFDAIENGRRVTWPANVNAGESEPESTATEEATERDTITSNPEVIKTREENRLKKKQKKTGSDAEHNRLLSLHLQNDDEKERMEKQIAELQAQLEEQEKKLREAAAIRNQESSKELRVPEWSTVVLQLQTLTEAVQSHQKQTDQRIGNLEKKVDEYFNSPRPSSSGVCSATSGSTSVLAAAAETEVPLGYGYTCTPRQLRVLESHQTEHSEWCNTLLEAVFKGESHLMRTKKTNKNLECKKFSKEFLRAAKGLHESWLKKKTTVDPVTLGWRPYNDTEVQDMLEKLPAYLSERSYSLWVQKNRPSQPQAKTNPPEGDSMQPPRRKRRYTKRGEIAPPLSIPSQATGPARLAQSVGAIQGEGPQVGPSQGAGPARLGQSAGASQGEGPARLAQSVGAIQGEGPQVGPSQGAGPARLGQSAGASQGEGPARLAQSVGASQGEGLQVGPSQGAGPARLGQSAGASQGAGPAQPAQLTQSGPSQGPELWDYGWLAPPQQLTPVSNEYLSDLTSDSFTPLNI